MATTPTRADLRRRHLTPKVDGQGGQNGWGLANLLAYCQGLAYDAASDAVGGLEEGGSGRNGRARRQALAAGLRAMIAELAERLALVEGDECSEAS